MEFDRAREVLAMTDGISPEKLKYAVLSQSYLRLEQPLTTTVSQINFPVLVNDTGSLAGVRITEQRLNLQDAFYASGISVYLTKAASATDTAFRLFTYPSPVVFPTGAGASSATAPLNTFYNGQYSITVNNDVLVPAFPLSSFLDVPETQLTAATNSPLDQYYGDGRISLQPNPVFIGQKKSKFSIQLPVNVSAIDANTYIVVIFNGVLAQNVTVVS